MEEKNKENEISEKGDMSEEINDDAETESTETDLTSTESSESTSPAEDETQMYTLTIKYPYTTVTLEVKKSDGGDDTTQRFVTSNNEPVEITLNPVSNNVGGRHRRKSRKSRRGKNRWNGFSRRHRHR